MIVKCGSPVPVEACKHHYCDNHSDGECMQNRCNAEATEAFIGKYSNTVIFRCKSHNYIEDAFFDRIDFNEAICMKVLDS